MRSTNSVCTDPQVLKNRITVTDKELTYLLGVGLETARKIADNANAVVFNGKRRMTLVSRIEDYLNSLV